MKKLIMGCASLSSSSSSLICPMGKLSQLSFWEGTAFLPGFFTSWCVVLLYGLITLLIILIYNDDDVIVLTRYGLIVVGTKWRHKYKYFGEAIDG